MREKMLKRKQQKRSKRSGLRKEPKEKAGKKNQDWARLSCLRN